VRVAAISTSTDIKAVRRTTRRLLFASRAALRMPRSAYLHELVSKLPLRHG
jgi:hypothetical protein